MDMNTDNITWRNRPIPARGVAIPPEWTFKACVIWARQIPTALGRKLAFSALDRMKTTGAAMVGTYAKCNLDMVAFGLDPLTAFDLYIRAEEAGVDGEQTPWAPAARVMGVDTKLGAMLYQAVADACEGKLLIALKDHAPRRRGQRLMELRALTSARG